MLEILSKNGPDGRNKWWTLVFVLLIPIPFLAILFGLFLVDYQRGIVNIRYVLAIIGLLLFVVLFSWQVIRGSYKNPLKHSVEIRFYQFVSWALIYLFALISDFAMVETLSKVPLINGNTSLSSFIVFFSSWIGWGLGGYYAQLSNKQNTQGQITPLLILQQTVLGLLGYIVLVIFVVLLINGIVQ